MLRARVNSTPNFQEDLNADRHPNQFTQSHNSNNNTPQEDIFPESQKKMQLPSKIFLVFTVAIVCMLFVSAILLGAFSNGSPAIASSIHVDGSVANANPDSSGSFAGSPSVTFSTSTEAPRVQEYCSREVPRGYYNQRPYSSRESNWTLIYVGLTIRHGDRSAVSLLTIYTVFAHSRTPTSDSEVGLTKSLVVSNGVYIYTIPSCPAPCSRDDLLS